MPNNMLLICMAPSYPPFKRLPIALRLRRETHIIKSMQRWIAARSRREVILTFIAIFLTTLILTAWLWFTPGGLLGKADSVGYAVCHRIVVRSFLIGERSFPVCARCSGMYLGALVSMVYLALHAPHAGMPSLKIAIALGLLVIAFGLDGVNSYLQLFPAAPALYQPNNYLRLFTGTGVGIGIGSVLVPVLRQTLQPNWDTAPLLGSWREFAVLVVLALGVDALLLTGNPLLLYPLALLSAGSVLLILSIIYTIVWAMILRRENRFARLWQAWPLLVAGFGTALLQIGVLDALRFALTGTWDGFHF